MEVQSDVSEVAAAPQAVAAAELAISHTGDAAPAPEQLDELCPAAPEAAADTVPTLDGEQVDLEHLDAGTLASLIAVGAVILTAAGFILAVRGGNYKVVRKNLQDAGKANAKQAMSEKQRILRRRKRKKG